MFDVYKMFVNPTVNTTISQLQKQLTTLVWYTHFFKALIEILQIYNVPQYLTDPKKHK